MMKISQRINTRLSHGFFVIELKSGISNQEAQPNMATPSNPLKTDCLLRGANLLRSARKFQNMTAPTRIKICLIVSCIAMLTGHWAILSSGATFDTQTGEKYNVFTRWVSDFAAKWPEGLWIKGSILIFCAALFDFFRMIIDRFSDQRLAGIWKLWWMILATAMIGGLLLVILFDISPTQYQYHGVGWFESLLGKPGSYIPIPPTPKDWIMQGHHRVGFKLFIIGFFLSAVSLAWQEWRSGLRHEITTTVYLLILSVIFYIWLFFMKTSLAGIPQRALLLLIFLWVFRSIPSITKKPDNTIYPTAVNAPV